MSTSHGTGHQQSVFAQVYSKKWSFLGVFIMVFMLMLLGLGSVGYLPDSVEASDTSKTASTNAEPVVTVTTSPLMVGPAAAVSNALVAAQGELPVKIVIAKINLSQNIANPSTTNVEALDQYLLNGAVRYPTSATLGQPGNIVLFGHSSYLPVVHNQAFKAFDGIQNLKAGDQITVYSKTHQYVYAVSTVTSMSATSDAIPLTTTGNILTLATCDSFGQKTDRFVVTANLVGSYALGS